MRREHLTIVAGVLVVAFLAWVWLGTAPPPPPSAKPAATVAFSASPSTIRPADYAGSEKCRDCHTEKFSDWSGHPHRLMNQDATKEAVRGDFSGVQVAYQGGTVTFATEAAGFTMTLAKGSLTRKYLVTRSVGSRFMQMYVGKQVEGPGSSAEEVKLSFGYWFKLKRWLPVSYFDPVGPETKADGTPSFDPYESPRVHAWRQNCMLCHNTVPYIERLALPDGLEGFPGLEHQFVSQPLLEEIGRAIDLSPKPDVPVSVKLRIQPTNLVQLGVACEACHFGSAEHARTSKREPKQEGAATSLLPSSPFVRWVSGKDRKPVEVTDANTMVMNGVCAQCHCATVTHFPNGAGTWNSREALDMIEGHCAQAIRCIDCHDPHVNDGREGLDTDPKHVATCTGCHPKWKDEVSARGHAVHGKDVTCLDCHMPRMTQGLEEVVRTHRISSPTDVRMLEKGSGNACNLCHLDKPIGWTLAALKEQFGREIAPVASWSAYYGEKLEKPVGRAWLEGADPSMRLVATQAYARSPLGKASLPDLVRALDDPIAVNRVFDTFAVSRIRGTELTMDEFDPTLPSAERRVKIDRILESLAH
ncbi:MAG TPA: ammonia-forming cytochrome c nitrite reductase subunit c552 [Planctomycetota bacterium]|nr:ammonia-forming cytochrome c nitrite reductase subunit c552 [Planctomycetota bacterium]